MRLLEEVKSLACVTILTLDLPAFLGNQIIFERKENGAWAENTYEEGIFDDERMIRIINALNELLHVENFN